MLTLLLLPWLSLALSLRAILQTQVDILAASKIPMGSEADIQLKVCAKDPQPPMKSKIYVFKPTTGEKWIRKPGDRLPTDHCGGLYVKLHKPWICDYLGLFRFRIRKTNQQTVYVWPERLNMGVPPDLTRYLARSWRPKPGGGYAENHEIRQYRDGDNLNQIHWKLSAKVGDLMLREPMEPERGVMLLTMDLRGTPEDLDVKFGRLLWLSDWLLDHTISFEVRVLTGNGIESWTITDEWSLQKCIEALLCKPFATTEDSIRERVFTAAWRHHIGGEPDEA